MLRLLTGEPAQDTDVTSVSSAHDIDDEDRDLMTHQNESLSSIGSSLDLADSKPADVQRYTSSINLLPQELLMYTFSHLNSAKDLRQCMLVSRSWASAAVSFLWHRPHVASLDTFQELATTLKTQTKFPYHRYIRRLNLSAFGKQVKDHQIRHFFTCNRIERLTLTNCNCLFDITLMFLIKNNPGLIALDVTGITNFSSATVLVLAEKCRKLQGLNISNCKNVSSDSLDEVARSCTALKRIKLNCCDQLTSQPILSFANYSTQLMEIDLHGVTELTDEAVTSLLTKCKQLRELRLAHCVRVTDAAFLRLPADISLDALRVLDLTECIELTDAGVSRIVSASPKLRNLAVAKCRQLEDATLRAISGLGRNLHHLHMGHCNRITDAGLIGLAQKCDRLRYIDLACCLQLTDNSIKYLATLPKLKRVGLVKCDNITDASIYALAQPKFAPWAKINSPLERVHLSYCRNLTLNSIQYLLNNCPDLTHLSLTGVQAFLREDMVRFCRPPPPEFNAHQQELFCVFSGKGVRDLRDFLNTLQTTLPSPSVNSLLPNAAVLSNMPAPNTLAEPGSRVFITSNQVFRSPGQNPDPLQENLPEHQFNPQFQHFVQNQLQQLQLQAVSSQPLYTPPGSQSATASGSTTQFSQTAGQSNQPQNTAQGVPPHSQWLPAFIPTTETWNPDTQSSIIPQVSANSLGANLNPPQDVRQQQRQNEGAQTTAAPQDGQPDQSSTTEQENQASRWDYQWVMARYRLLQEGLQPSNVFPLVRPYSVGPAEVERLHQPGLGSRLIPDGNGAPVSTSFYNASRSASGNATSNTQPDQSNNGRPGPPN